MKIGVILNNQQRAHGDMVSALDEQMAMVRLARDRGWDSFLSSMHYLSDGDVQQLQQIPLLARLQAEAGHMTMGVAIFLLPLHNPVYAAETLATLDVIARGNFVIGLGLGYRQVEFDAFGTPMDQRVRRFNEHLTLIKRLWTEDSVTAETATCKLHNVKMNLRPVQKPYPPLWIAANHDNAVKRAAHVGDCWYINPHSTLETVRRQWAIFRAERTAAGLPPARELPCRKEIFCAKDRRTAIQLAAPYLGEKYKIYTRWGQDKAMPVGERLDLPFEQLAQDRFIIGSPEDCIEQLRPYGEELGVTHLVFRTHFIGMPLSLALQSMQLISDEVLPVLRRMRPAAA